MTDILFWGIIVLAVWTVLWIFFKILKLAWQFTFLGLIILGLSFALPATREWIFDLF